MKGLKGIKSSIKISTFDLFAHITAKYLHLNSSENALKLNAHFWIFKEPNQ